MSDKAEDVRTDSSSPDQEENSSDDPECETSQSKTRSETLEQHMRERLAREPADSVRESIRKWLERSREQSEELMESIEQETHSVAAPRNRSLRHSAPAHTSSSLEWKMMDHMRSELAKERPGSPRSLTLLKWLERAEVHREEVQRQEQREEQAAAYEPPSRPASPDAGLRRHSVCQTEFDAHRKELHSSHSPVNLLFSKFRSKFGLLKKEKRGKPIPHTA